MDILLDLSGGSTKGRAEYYVAKYAILKKGLKPTIISSVSIGTVLAVPIAMGKFSELEKALSDFDLNSIFTRPPVNLEGDIIFNCEQ